jgi:hypothetical protein
LLLFRPPGTVFGTNPPAGVEITLDTEIVVYVVTDLGQIFNPPGDRQPPDNPPDRPRDRHRDRRRP